MSANFGHVYARIMLELPGADEPVLLSPVALPLKAGVRGGGTVFELAIDLESVANAVRAIFDAEKVAE